jgi:hypothetical protein
MDSKPRAAHRVGPLSGRACGLRPFGLPIQARLVEHSNGRRRRPLTQIKLSSTTLALMAYDRRRRGSQGHGRSGAGADPSGSANDLSRERAELASRLLEAVNRGELKAPRRLIRLMEAMVAVGHASGTKKPGQGTVFIAWDEDRYIGYWDALPDGPPQALEQMPEYETTADAIAWGRARTPRVLIRPRSDLGRADPMAE